MKVVAQRNGDVITATAMGVDIKLELVGGKGGFHLFWAPGLIGTDLNFL